MNFHERKDDRRYVFYRTRKFLPSLPPVVYTSVPERSNPMYDPAEDSYYPTHENSCVHCGQCHEYLEPCHESLKYDPSVLHLSGNDTLREELAAEANRAADVLRELDRVLRQLGEGDARLRTAASLAIEAARKLES